MKQKACTCCKTEKNPSDFHKNKRRSDGLDIYCKSCANDKKKVAYRKYREQNLEKMKQYRERNPEQYYEMHKKRNDRWLSKKENEEKMREYHKQYHINHKNERNDRSKKWYKDNPNSQSSILKKYRGNNSSKVLARVAERRASKLQATPKWFERDNIEKLYEQRQKISVETGVEHHVDHIIPLNGKDVCGLHCLDNLQIITAEENIKKGNRLYK